VGQQLDLSIVVSTRNRARYLTQMLSSYERIATEASWELIVVDNGSSDETPEFLHRFSEAAKIPLRHFYEPRPGGSRGRNYGWRHATGRVIAFTDDDCYPQADFVDAIRANFVPASIGYLGGRILLFDPRDHPITIQPNGSRLVFPPGTFIYAGAILGANIAVRKDVMMALGGFDELIGSGTRFPCEDLDLLTRASFAGFTGVYDPRPVVLHHHRRQSQEQVQALERLYAHGRGAYYAKGLLTPKQRGKALGTWCRSTCKRMITAFRAPPEALICFRELQGAIDYWGVRLQARREGREKNRTV
jgi:glycosyltransferase involved in cell wall biosynthesis